MIPLEEITTGMRAKFYFGSYVFSTVLWLVHASAQQYPAPFPRPNADKLLENDRLIAWKVIWPKNQPTPMHEHLFDQLSVTLAGGQVKVTRLSGNATVNTSSVGSVAFTPKGTVHVEEGVSDSPQQKVMLELKPSAPPIGDAAGDSEMLLRQGAVKLLENDRLIAWDVHWKTGQEIQFPAGRLDSVAVFVAPGTIHSATRQRDIKDISRNSGDIAFTPRGAGPQSQAAVQGTPRAVIVWLK